MGDGVTEDSGSGENKKIDESEDLNHKLEKFAAARNKLDESTQELDKNTNKVLSDNDGRLGAEISATTIGRMLGLVTVTDFRVFEGKFDLLQTRLNSIIVKLDGIQDALQKVPNGSDIDRIESQLATIKTMLSESRSTQNRISDEEAAQDAERSQKQREGIVSNRPISGAKFMR
jgi:DNA-binding transcriptional regulator/RsmH inhibitor MraZ